MEKKTVCFENEYVEYALNESILKCLYALIRASMGEFRGGKNGEHLHDLALFATSILELQEHDSTLRRTVPFKTKLNVQRWEAWLSQKPRVFAVQSKHTSRPWASTRWFSGTPVLALGMTGQVTSSGAIFSLIAKLDALFLIEKVDYCTACWSKNFRSSQRTFIFEDKHLIFKRVYNVHFKQAPVWTDCTTNWTFHRRFSNSSCSSRGSTCLITKVFVPAQVPPLCSQ